MLLFINFKVYHALHPHPPKLVILLMKEYEKWNLKNIIVLPYMYVHVGICICVNSENVDFNIFK